VPVAALSLCLRRYLPNYTVIRICNVEIPGGVKQKALGIMEFCMRC
jgi:hypothetical protein